MKSIKLTNNKCAEISIINSRQLRLKTNSEYPTITKENDDIIGLSYYGEFSVNINDTIKIDNADITYNYKVQYIEQESAGSFILTEELRNKTSRFLFPLITHVGAVSGLYYYNQYFYNAYTSCANYPQYNDNKHLFIVYKFFNHEGFKKFETTLQNHKNIVDTIDISVDKVLYIFEMPIEYLECINLFLKGSYLKFPDNSKIKIFQFYADCKSELALEVLKDSAARRKELSIKLGYDIPKDIPTMSKPNIEEEVLKL